MEEEVHAMDRGIRAAENRPGKMMTFLCKLADDPTVVLRAMVAKKVLAVATILARRRVSAMGLKVVDPKIFKAALDLLPVAKVPSGALNFVGYHTVTMTSNQLYGFVMFA